MDFLEKGVWDAFEQANQEYNKSEKDFRAEMQQMEQDIIEAARAVKFDLGILQFTINQYRKLNRTNVVPKEVMEAIKLLQK